jgi:energy-coupling factor transporter transmembrane protein EcfT
MITGSIITNSLALLAFVVAFYTLIAREKKTPYITNYIFPPAVLLFVTILLVLLGQLIHAWRQGLPELLNPTYPTSAASQTSTVFS